MLSLVVLAYTGLMLIPHLFGRWLVPAMLARPRMFWSARWLFRFEVAYYVLLGIFWSRHTAAFPLWPAAALAVIHLAGWLVGEYHPALAAAVPWTPGLERRINQILVFDLAEAVFLVYVARKLLLGASFW